MEPELSHQLNLHYQGSSELILYQGLLPVPYLRVALSPALDPEEQNNKICSKVLPSTNLS
jgi:hypothetical protein